MSKAKKVDGVVDVFTWEDVPTQRFSNAGQTYPETSPYDRLIIDRHVRYVGDVVAIVAAETEQAADKALSRIKVTYDVLEPVLDFTRALDNPVVVHPEDDWKMLCDLGSDSKRNLVSTTGDADGDIEAVLADCDVVIDRTYHTKAFNQAMMETFRTFTELDRYGRLHRHLVHADRVPRAPHPVARAGHPEKPHPRGETAHRRRVRREADGRVRDVPRVRHHENGPPGHVRVHARGGANVRLAAPRDADPRAPGREPRRSASARA